MTARRAGPPVPCERARRPGAGQLPRRRPAQPAWTARYPASGSGTRRWPWSSRSATTACTCCSGSGPRRRSRDDGRCPAARWKPDERLGTSLGRHLAAKVDLTDIAYLEQLETRSDPARDPRGRVLATAYLALVSADVEPRIPADTAWHRVQELPPTAFDHGSIAESGRDRLRAKLSYTNIGFALAPDDVHDRSAAGHLRRVGRPPGFRDQPAARPDPPRRHRGDPGGRPAHLGGRAASHPLPVHGPDPGRHQSFRRVPAPERAAG